MSKRRKLRVILWACRHHCCAGLFADGRPSVCLHDSRQPPPSPAHSLTSHFHSLTGCRLGGASLQICTAQHYSATQRHLNLHVQFPSRIQSKCLLSVPRWSFFELYILIHSHFVHVVKGQRQNGGGNSCTKCFVNKKYARKRGGNRSAREGQ